MYKAEQSWRNWGNWSEKWLFTEVVLEEWVGISAGWKWERICRQKELPRTKMPCHKQTFPSFYPLVTCTTLPSYVCWKYWFLFFSLDIWYSISWWGQRNCICIKSPWWLLCMQGFKHKHFPVEGIVQHWIHRVEKTHTSKWGRGLRAESHVPFWGPGMGTYWKYSAGKWNGQDHI